MKHKNIFVACDTSNLVKIKKKDYSIENGQKMMIWQDCA